MNAQPIAAPSPGRATDPDARKKRNIASACGLLLVAIGVTTCVFPFAGSIFIGSVLGWALIVGGMASIVVGIHAIRGHGHWLDLVLGLASTVFGLAILTLPLAGAVMLLWSLSLWFALRGVMEIAAGIHVRDHRVMILFIGVTDLILSAYLLFAFATIDFVLVALLVGFSFIMSGSSLLVRGIRATDAQTPACAVR